MSAEGQTLRYDVDAKYLEPLLGVDDVHLSLLVRLHQEQGPALRGAGLPLPAILLGRLLASAGR